MPTLPLLPLADGGAIIGVILLVVTVIGGMIQSAKEKQKQKIIQRGGGRTDLDERIRQRQDQRRAEARRDEEIEDADDDAIELVLPAGIEPSMLTPQDRAAIAARMRAEAARNPDLADALEQRRQAQEERQEAERQRQMAAERERKRRREEAERRREAAERPKPAPIATRGSTEPIRPAAQAVAAARSTDSRGDRMRRLLRKPESFKTILIATEVLGKPVGLRDGR